MDSQNTLATAPKPDAPMQLSHSPETASTVLAAQAKALIEARYIMAERHPRDLDVVREKLLKECRRPGFAQVARYLKPIGKGVEGPSIRFAETAIRLMGNISVDQLTVYDDREKRIVRVIVVDCETNTPYSSDITLEKTVERRNRKDGDEVVRTRQNKQGTLLYIIAATEDDLLNKQNALISKAIRTNGLRLIPGDIVEECMDEVLRTQQTRDAQDPDAARRKIFDAFSVIGVPVEQLKIYLGHEAATLTNAEILNLRGVYSAIRDGETNWREVMEALKPAEVERPAQEGKHTTEEIKKELKARQAVSHSAPVQEVKPEEIWPKNREPGDDEDAT